MTDIIKPQKSALRTWINDNVDNGKNLYLPIYFQDYTSVILTKFISILTAL